MLEVDCLYLLPHNSNYACKIADMYNINDLSQSLEDNNVCHFCSYNVIEFEGHFVLECPLYDSIRDKFPSLFENVVLKSLKSFYKLDHQVDISLYLTEATALCYSSELARLTPS